MKKWVLMFLGSFGAFYAVIKDLVVWLESENPMNVDQWTLRIIIILSISFGIFLFCRFLYKLNRKVRDHIKDYSKLDKWVTFEDPNYKKREFDSLEEKISYIIDVWTTGRQNREKLLIDPDKVPYHRQTTLK